MKTPGKTDSPPIQRRIRVEVADGAGASGSAEPLEIRAWIVAALDHVRISPGRNLDVSVSLVDADSMAALNRDYRRKDRPTNVLSFPGGNMAGLPEGEPELLGDIVLCPEVIAAEAAEQGKPVAAHWAHLCVHGALHLAGFDHTEPGEAADMEGIEIAVLDGLGLPDPYEAR